METSSIQKEKLDIFHVGKANKVFSLPLENSRTRVISWDFISRFQCELKRTREALNSTSLFLSHLVWIPSWKHSYTPVWYILLDNKMLEIKTIIQFNIVLMFSGVCENIWFPFGDSSSDLWNIYVGKIFFLSVFVFKTSHLNLS